MNDHQQLVREFHSRFGLTINDTPTLSPADDILRVNLIHEEAMELWEAERENDRVAIADALGDLAYVIYGAGVTYGVELEVKRQSCFLPSPAGILRGMVELADRFETVISADMKPHAFRGPLNNLISAVHEISLSYSIPLDPVFREIHRSNMSKLWSPSEVQRVFNVSYAEAVSREIVKDGMRVKNTGDGRWIVERESDGKIIKSPSYLPANLAPILANP